MADAIGSAARHRCKPALGEIDPSKLSFNSAEQAFAATYFPKIRWFVFHTAGLL
jgi:hypothetical protein